MQTTINKTEAKKKKLHATIYTDGATVGRNGKLGTVAEVGIGCWITGDTLDIKIAQRKDGISNNEAEFKALITAMEVCLNVGVTEALFKLDSMIVVNRANGSSRKKEKNARMGNFQKKVLELSEKFEKVEFVHIPREYNGIADDLSKKFC